MNLRKKTSSKQESPFITYNTRKAELVKKSM